MIRNPPSTTSPAAPKRRAFTRSMSPMKTRLKSTTHIGAVRLSGKTTVTSENVSVYHKSPVAVAEKSEPSSIQQTSRLAAWILPLAPRNGFAASRRMNPPERRSPPPRRAFAARRSRFRNHGHGGVHERGEDGEYERAAEFRPHAAFGDVLALAHRDERHAPDDGERAQHDRHARLFPQEKGGEKYRPYRRRSLNGTGAARADALDGGVGSQMAHPLPQATRQHEPQDGPER